MARPALLLFCLLAHAASVEAADALIRSITIRGCSAVSERKLLDAASSRPQRSYSAPQLASDLAVIVEIYRADGYYAAEALVDTLVFTSDSALVDVSLLVREGDRYLIGALTFAGNAALSGADLRAATESGTGSPLDARLLEQDIARILFAYERAGYPFAAVRVGPIEARAEGATLDVSLLIDEGARVVIRDVRATGNTSTRDAVILRESRMSLPEQFDPEKLTRVGNRLRRLNLFSLVAEPQLRMSDSGGVVILRVEEGRTSTFDGVIGYAPGLAPGDDGVVAGSVRIGLRNLFGTARVLNLRWQKDDRSSQEIFLQYVEPWVFNVPLNLGGTFQQRQQDSAYLRRSVAVAADLLLTESFTVAGSVGHDVTIPSVSAGPRPVANSRTLTAGLEIRYDSRNDAISPTSGVLYQNEYRIGDKKIFGPADERSTLQKVSLDLQWYTQPLSRNVILVGLHGRQVTNDRLETSDLYRFGGTNTLRGYRELQFLGSRVAWTNVEYRLLLERRSFCYGFFDSGYYLLPADDVLGVPSSQGVKYGYGIGIRLETSLGNLGVSFALGGGDGLSGGKIHFGIINEF